MKEKYGRKERAAKSEEKLVVNDGKIIWVYNRAVMIFLGTVYLSLSVPLHTTPLLWSEVSVNQDLLPDGVLPDRRMLESRVRGLPGLYTRFAFYALSF